MQTISELDREKYRDLWRGVLYRAIEDLYTASEDELYGKNLLWFDHKSPDFQMVCAFADIEETAVINIVRCWKQQEDKRLVRIMMMKEGILPPTEKDKIARVT